MRKFDKVVNGVTFQVTVQRWKEKEGMLSVQVSYQGVTKEGIMTVGVESKDKLAKDLDEFSDKLAVEVISASRSRSAIDQYFSEGSEQEVIEPEEAR